jgi:hypothetical protein
MKHLTEVDIAEKILALNTNKKIPIDFKSIKTMCNERAPRYFHSWGVDSNFVDLTIIPNVCYSLHITEFYNNNIKHLIRE